MLSAALERHFATPCAAVRAIQASIARDADGRVTVSYRIEGDLARLRIPAAAPARFADKLWQHTCCEIFLAEAEGAGYTEFNFSPSGEWAAYRFARYREGAPLAARDPRIRVKRTASTLTLEAQIMAKGRLRIGLAAVIEESGGVLSYWALRHPAGKPDFHHRDAFALELDEVRH